MLLQMLEPVMNRLQNLEGTGPEVYALDQSDVEFGSGEEEELIPVEGSYASGLGKKLAKPKRITVKGVKGILRTGSKA